jgi:subtilisin family serine protease
VSNSDHDDGDPRSRDLDERAARYIISPKLFEAAAKEASHLLSEEKPGVPRVWMIFEINLATEMGRESAHRVVADMVEKVIAGSDGAKMKPADSSRHHIFAYLSMAEAQAIVDRDAEHARAAGAAPAIFKVWPDRPLDAYLDRSVRIIKSDACLRSFGADGDKIVWAVADSGIHADHPHFAAYGNLDPIVDGVGRSRSGRAEKGAATLHRDFTGEDSPLTDEYGHGTHVAGIIAGISPTGWEATSPAAAAASPPPPVYRITRERDDQDRVRSRVHQYDKVMRGVAPKARLVSLKVLNGKGRGQESSLLSALDYVMRVNDDGRWLRIHGVNLSLGYGFDAEWFAAGHSPLCVAVNRLVSYGVVVVAAAGNDGSAIIVTENSPAGRRVGIDQSITDPGNAEDAITVGSTHPEQPHTYGISFFSSRGPTADGRLKPDLVAPGERILSAASPGAVARLMAEDQRLESDDHIAVPGAAYYRQESGTSMAAPHVSGAIAAFLSVRSEFMGKPRKIKQILMETATDLKRRPEFQGAGLLDLLRAIESV